MSGVQNPVIESAVLCAIYPTRITTPFCVVDVDVTDFRVGKQPCDFPLNSFPFDYLGIKHHCALAVSAERQ
ncbi:hypothetical protein C4J95_3456 [Pseudomonas orientalis]|nr:hypothetical protein C4J96_3386 [Pseudomonas orientalis]AZF00912.1 hypothetical protein C4J95_3456 [Pseudomonas orientalis]